MTLAFGDETVRGVTDEESHRRLGTLTFGLEFMAKHICLIETQIEAGAWLAFVPDHLRHLATHCSLEVFDQWRGRLPVTDSGLKLYVDELHRELWRRVGIQ